MIRPAIRRAVRGAMKFAMNSNTPRYEQIVTGNVVRAMADRVYLDASASGTSDIYNNTHQLAITGGIGSGQSGLINDYVVDSVTNQSPDSVNFTAWIFGGTPVITANTWIGVLGLNDGYTVEDDDITLSEFIREDAASFDVTKANTVSIYVEKDSIPKSTRFCQLRIVYTGSTFESYGINFATDTGEYINMYGAAYGDVGVEDIGHQWRIHVTATSQDIANTSARILFYPAFGAGNDLTINSPSVTGSANCTGAQFNESSIQEYVPTSGLVVTETVRVAHIPSDFTTIPQGPANSTYAVNKVLGVP